MNIDQLLKDFASPAKTQDDIDKIEQLLPTYAGRRVMLAKREGDDLIPNPALTMEWAALAEPRPRIYKGHAPVSFRSIVKPAAVTTEEAEPITGKRMAEAATRTFWARVSRDRKRFARYMANHPDQFGELIVSPKHVAIDLAGTDLDESYADAWTLYDLERLTDPGLDARLDAQLIWKPAEQRRPVTDPVVVHYNADIARPRTVLATLYTSPDQLRMLCGDSGIDPTMVDFTGPTAAVAEAVLAAAQRHGRLHRLWSLVAMSYPHRQDVRAILISLSPDAHYNR